VIPHGSRWSVAAAAIALGALATWNSTRKSLWIDEAYSEYTSRLPLLGAVRRGIHYELQPPLYFGLLALWRDLNHSVLFARGFSALAAMAFVGVMAGIGRRAGFTRWWWLGIAAACVPGVVWAASELRLYALVLLLAALTFYFLLGITRATGRAAPVDLIGYVIAGSALVYTFYYGGFVLLGQLIGTMIGKRRALRVAGLLGVVGCGLIPMIPVIRMQMAKHPVDAPIDFGTNLHLALFDTGRVLLGVFEGHIDMPSFPHVIPIFATIALGIPLTRTLAPRARWDRAEIARTVAAGMPIAALGILRATGATNVSPKHLLVALPGLLLLYATWIRRTDVGWPRLASTSVLAAVTAISLVRYERDKVQMEDWRGAARYVAARAAPGDMVLVYDPDRMLPFNDYFQPIAPTIAVHSVPVDINLETYNPYAYAIPDTAAVGARVRSLHMLDHPVWFISADRVFEPIHTGPATVLAYLGAHDDLDAPVALVGVSIVHARPKAPHDGM